MKRENLYLVGGALLASTALTTTATAGTYTVITTSLADGAIAGVSTSARGVSAQIFAATPEASKLLGTASLAYRFNQGMSARFTLVGALTGARFNTASVTNTDIRALVGTTGVTSGTVALVATATSIGCGVAVAIDKLILSDCTPNATGLGATSIGGLLVSSVAFDNATGLATAGGTIAMDASITVGGVAFETTASQGIITSRNSLTTTVTAASPALINVGSSPAFSAMTNGLTVTLSTVSITQTGAVAADLTTIISGATAVGATSSIKLTSAVLSDDATTKAELVGAGLTVSRTLTSFGAGFVTFTVAAASIQDIFTVRVNFNGTAAIDTAAAGSVEVAYAAIGAAAQGANNAAPPGATGTAAGLARNGLSINVNSIQPSVAQGARTYSSLLRIVNSGTVAGTVAIALRNNETGAALGTYTSPSIPAGGSIQVTSAQLETGAGITPTASVLYQGTLTGNITGYVQHVNWNQDAGFFSDLSANRQ